MIEAEPDHLDHLFDYAVPPDLEGRVRVGSRVEVDFSGRRLRGIVAELVGEPGVAPDRVRPLRRVLGDHVWLTRREQALIRWAADRYAAPAGDVLRHALPDRVVDVERALIEDGWSPRAAGEGSGGEEQGGRGETGPGGTGPWKAYGAGGRALTRAAADGSGFFYLRPLPGEDVGGLIADLARRTLAAGRDVLVVVPAPVSRVADRVAALGADLTVDVRGGPGARDLYRGWLMARCGRARVVVGERGVAFWPLRRAGLLVVVEESNPALKERRSPRHHAREVLLERARRAGAVGLLVGTVPSANGWRLLADRRLRPVVPARAAERASAPLVRVDAGEGQPVRTRLGKPGVEALRTALEEGSYGVVLAARRGEGRALACAGCGLRVRCPACEASVAPSGAGGGGILCEGCGRHLPEARSCERCGGGDLVPLAAGARRLGHELSRTFRGARVAVLEGYAQPAPPAPAVLVTTRGSVLDDPPGPVGAAVLPDLDGQLRRPALDAAEDALRLSMAVASWTVAGAPVRAAASASTRRPQGVVVAQTREPDHHAVRALVAWDPGGFWRAEVALRRALRFPPAAHAVRLDVAGDGAREAADLAGALPDGDEVLGPVPAGGRASLLVKCDDRVATTRALRPLREAWSRAGRDVRVDVDPVDVD